MTYNKVTLKVEAGQKMLIGQGALGWQAVQLLGSQRARLGRCSEAERAKVDATAAAAAAAAAVMSTSATSTT